MSEIDYNEFPDHLQFPAFKLWERAQYERECASEDHGIESGSTSNGPAGGQVVRASAEENAAARARALARAESCEAALDLLRSPR